jgi:hypothetical protein
MCSAGAATVIIGSTMLGLLLACATGCEPEQEQSPATVTVEKDRATVRGVVRENVTTCQVDGPWYLLLNGQTGAVTVHYHHGENPRCVNELSTRTGLSITSGDSIEAVGDYSEANGTYIVDVCCPDCTLTVTRRR